MRFSHNTKYDEFSGNRRWNSKDGLYYWTIFILLLVLLTIICWAGSYFIFGHPEKAFSYQILKKLKKLEVPQKFELTAAPKGEFLDPNALLQRYGSMHPALLEQVNGALLRNFIRNYKETSDLVPYITGTYSILDSFELTPKDFFPSGVVALAQATDNPTVLLESVYTCEPRVVPILHRTVLTGLNIRLEKRFDLSALLHVERLPDGRMLFTTIPILYGDYASSHGPGSFSLRPPDPININAKLPLLSHTRISAADETYLEYLQKAAGIKQPTSPTHEKITSNEKTDKTSPSASEQQTPALSDRLIRIEKPEPISSDNVTVHNNPHPIANALTKKRFLTSSPSSSFASTTIRRALPPPAASIQEVPIARALPAAATLTATPFPSQPKNTPAITQQDIKAALPVGLSGVTQTPTPLPPTELPSSLTTGAEISSDNPSSSTEKESATTTTAASSSPSSNPVALATTTTQAFTSVASGNWETFEAGKMPKGRLIEPSETQQLSEKELGTERIYLKGNFLVTAARANRAVLRSPNSNRLLGNSAAKIRVIVEFPSNSKTPEFGSTFNRGAQRPFLITDIKKAPNGIINVFAREITHE